MLAEWSRSGASWSARRQWLVGVGARQRLCRVSRLSNWKRKKSLQARKSIHLSSGGFYCNKGENGASLRYLGGSVIIEHLDKQVGIARAASLHEPVPPSGVKFTGGILVLGLPTGQPGWASPRGPAPWPCSLLVLLPSSLFLSFFFWMTLFCLFPVDCFAGLRSKALLLVHTSVAAAAASTTSHLVLSCSPITSDCQRLSRFLAFC